MADERHRLHVEELLGLRVHHRRLARLAGLRVERLRPAHRQARHPADDGLLRIRELVDELHHVVLEELFFARVEELDGLLAVRGIRAGETEVDVLPVRARGRAAHAELVRTIFVFGERLRIDHRQVQLAVRARGQLLEQLAHARAVGLELGRERLADFSL